MFQRTRKSHLPCSWRGIFSPSKKKRWKIRQRSTYLRSGNSALVSVILNFSTSLSRGGLSHWKALYFRENIIIIIHKWHAGVLNEIKKCIIKKHFILLTLSVIRFEPNSTYSLWNYLIFTPFEFQPHPYTKYVISNIYYRPIIQNDILI